MCIRDRYRSGRTDESALPSLSLTVLRPTRSLTPLAPARSENRVIQFRGLSFDSVTFFSVGRFFHSPETNSRGPAASVRTVVPNAIVSTTAAAQRSFRFRKRFIGLTEFDWIAARQQPHWPHPGAREFSIRNNRQWSDFSVNSRCESALRSTRPTGSAACSDCGSEVICERVCRFSLPPSQQRFLN